MPLRPNRRDQAVGVRRFNGPGSGCTLGAFVVSTRASAITGWVHALCILRRILGSAASLSALVLLSTTARANPVVVEGETAQLAGAFDVLVESGASWTIDEVSEPGSTRRFERSSAARPNFGYTRDTIWLRFSIENRSSSDSLFVDVCRAWVGTAVLYTRSGAGWSEARFDASAPWGSRPSSSERVVFPLQLPRGQVGTFYLRLRGDGPISVLGEVSTPAVHARSEALSHLGYGGFYATLVFIALYAFLLFTSLRERGYLWFGLSLGGLVLGEVCAHGHAQRYLGPDPWAELWFGAWWLCVFAFALLQYSRAYLGLAQRPVLDRLVLVAMVAFAAIGVVSPTGAWSHPAAFLALVPGIFLLVAAGVLRWRDGHRPAAFYSVAMLSFLLPGLVSVCVILGLAPPNPFTEHAVHGGGIAMALLLSFGQADRIHQYNRASSRFVPVPLIRQLGHSTIVTVEHAEGVRREMTVMFMDIRNFTGISEGMTPEQNFAFINEVLRAAVPEVRREGGFIDKFIGDAVLALFPGEPEAALRAACAMHRRVSELRCSDGSPVRIGIGLHHGSLMLGTIGDSERMEVTVISDAVNLASRMEGLTKTLGASVVLSDATRNRLGQGSGVALRALGRLQVKGRLDPVQVWQLLDAEPSESQAKKASTAEVFERGVRLAYERKLDAAAACFREVLMVDSRDGAAAYYLAELTREEDRGPVSDQEWSGIDSLKPSARAV